MLFRRSARAARAESEVPSRCPMYQNPAPASNRLIVQMICPITCNQQTKNIRYANRTLTLGLTDTHFSVSPTRRSKMN